MKTFEDSLFEAHPLGKSTNLGGHIVTDYTVPTKEQYGR